MEEPRIRMQPHSLIRMAVVVCVFTRCFRASEKLSREVDRAGNSGRLETNLGAPGAPGRIGHSILLLVDHFQRILIYAKCGKRFGEKISKNFCPQTREQ